MIPKTVFSPCRTWRYLLYRPATMFYQGPPLLVNLINPSTADEDRDDPTSVWMQKWAASNGYGDVLMTNPHALVSSNPGDLDRHPDPVGPDNDRWIQDAVSYTRDMGGSVVIGWGTRNAGDQRDRMIELLGTPIFCFGKTKAGFPAFPTAFLMRTKPSWFRSTRHQHPVSDPGSPVRGLIRPQRIQRSGVRALDVGRLQLQTCEHVVEHQHTADTELIGHVP